MVVVMVMVELMVMERMLTCYERFVHVVEKKKVEMGGLQLPHTALLHPAKPGLRIRIRIKESKDQGLPCCCISATRIQDSEARINPPLHASFSSLPSATFY